VVKVIIAEDDLAIAALLKEALEASGYEVCGIADTVAGAIELCNRTRPDQAIIDMRLADDGCGMDVAAGIAHRETISILYATGNAGYSLLTAADGEACITKPYHAGDLLRALQIVAEIKRHGTASRPFPTNFQVLRPAP